MPRWFYFLAIVVVVLTTLPSLVGWLQTPEGSTYLGIQWNLDDHAVYAAWMKQAQEGRFFFENRFTTDEQPGLTIHLYFWLLGLVSKVTGIVIAMHVGRIVFSLLALFALYRLVSKLTTNETSRALAMFLAVFGGGIGWLMWKRYGHDGPIDVWQPEAFVFPSLMTNGLFAVSLWLILVVLNKLLDARESWKPVVPGALALLVLTNIHTYDVMLIALISSGWLVSCVLSHTATLLWVTRSFVIACGALPALAWFLYVRSVDPVFVERANTPTPAPPPMSVLLGVLPLAVFALVAIAFTKSQDEAKQRWLPVAILVILGVTFNYVCDGMRAEDSFAAPPFIICYAIALIACAAFTTNNPIWSLFFAWMAISIVAPYYPALFQRKLGMMMALPYGVLAGVGLALVATRIRSIPIRIVSVGTLLIILSLSSLRWIQRELQMIRNDVSNTTVHRIYLDRDASEILRMVTNMKGEDDVLLARPGVPVNLGDDEYDVVISDLNPIMTGWAGVKTYAGHWSETPRYSERREDLSSRLYNLTTATPESISEIVEKTGATFLILPVREDLRPFVVPVAVFSGLPREVLYTGDDLILLRIIQN